LAINYKQMNRYFNILCLSIMIIIGWTSCAKVEGYYDFENKESIYNGNTIAYFESKPEVFDSLLTVLNRFPELKEKVRSEAVTVFAPTNASFEIALNSFNLVRINQNKSPLYINDLDMVQLDTVINKYLVQGLVTTDSMLYVDGLYMKTLNYDLPMHAQRIKEEASGLVDGGLVRVYYSDTKKSNFVSQWTRSQSQAVNISTTNGIVHILANGHEFGFGEFLNRFNR